MTKFSGMRRSSRHLAKYASVSLSPLDAAEELVADEVAHLVVVVEVPAAGRSDEREDARGEVVGGPFDVDAVAQPAGSLPPARGTACRKLGDERQRLAPTRS